MAEVQNYVEIFPKVSIRVVQTNVADDGQMTDGFAIAKTRM